MARTPPKRPSPFASHPSAPGGITPPLGSVAPQTASCCAVVYNRAPVVGEIAAGAIVTDSGTRHMYAEAVSW